MSKIAPCLWFGGNAEEAVTFYVGTFPNSRIGIVSRAEVETPGRKSGDVLFMAFEMDGRPFTALNGPPLFKFSEALSLTVTCETQDEIDRIWFRLCDGGSEGQCGWLKDRYGLSWQIVPAIMGTLMTGAPDRTQRVMAAMMKMRKLDIEAPRNAAEQE